MTKCFLVFQGDVKVTMFRMAFRACGGQNCSSNSELEYCYSARIRSTVLQGLPFGGIPTVLALDFMCFLVSQQNQDRTVPSSLTSVPTRDNVGDLAWVSRFGRLTLIDRMSQWVNGALTEWSEPVQLTELCLVPTWVSRTWVNVTPGP